MSGCPRDFFQRLIPLVTLLAITGSAYATGLLVVDIDPRSNTYGHGIDRIRTGSTSVPYPENIALRSDGTLAVVANAFEDTVAIIDTDPTSPTYNQNLAIVFVGRNPQGVAFKPPDERYAYVALNSYENAVVVVDTQLAQVVGDPIPVEVGLQAVVAPFGVTFKPDGSRAYVSEMAIGMIAVIDTSTPPHQIATIPLDPSDSPLELVYRAQVGSEGDKLYVANNGSSSVGVVDLAFGTVQYIPVLTGPEGIALTRDRRLLYVTNEDAAALSEIDVDGASPTLNTVVYTYQVGNTPERVAIDAVYLRVLVTNEYSCNTSVIDVDPGSPNFRSVTAIDAPDYPEGIVVTPDGKRAYILSEISKCLPP